MTEYPDFRLQIHELKMLLGQTEDEQKSKIIRKWIASLEDIHEQITRLEKIEMFAQKIKKD